MTDVLLSADMLGILRDLRGKTFKSYECLLDPGIHSSSTYGNLRINLGRSAVEVRCRLIPVDDFLGGPDEAAALTCEVVNRSIPFIPYVKGVAKSYMVDEVIRNVEVVRDHVDCNDGASYVNMDVAFVIRTRYRVFAFSIDTYFDETIKIEIVDTNDRHNGVTPIESLWIGSDDLTLTVTREVLEL